MPKITVSNLVLNKIQSKFSRIFTLRFLQSESGQNSQDGLSNKRFDLLKSRKPTVVSLEYHKSPHAIEQGREGDVAIISFNQPETKNAIGHEQINQLTEIINSVRSNNLVRICIFRSLVENIFCAGANLKQRDTMNQHELRNYLQTQRELFDRVQNIPIPTVAAVDGYALGGGLEFALACDMIIINEAARVGLVETRLGIIPGAGGTQRLSRRIGNHKAKELISTARIIDGSTAHQLGITNQLATGPDGAYKLALKLSYEIVDKSPLSLRLAKLSVDKGSELDLATGLDVEQICYGQLISSKDRLEGLKAFLEKRKPVFKGE